MYHDPDGYDITDCDPITYHDCEHCTERVRDGQRCGCRQCMTGSCTNERLPGKDDCAKHAPLYCSSCNERITGWVGDGRCGECVRDEAEPSFDPVLCTVKGEVA